MKVNTQKKIKKANKEGTEKDKKQPKQDKKQEVKESKENYDSTIPQFENPSIQKDNRIDFLLTKEYLNNSEVQFNKHLSAIENQIKNSDEILSTQEKLFKMLSNINKEITTTDIKLEKFIVRNESDDYYNFIEKYSANLDELLLLLKSQSKELELLRHLKEENKHLKSKIELIEIEKRDYEVVNDTKIELFKGYLVAEFNSFGEYIRDFDESVFFNKFTSKNFDESSCSLYFQNLKVFLRGVFKGKEEFKSKYF